MGCYSFRCWTERDADGKHSKKTPRGCIYLNCGAQTNSKNNEHVCVLTARDCRYETLRIGFIWLCLEVHSI